LKNGWLNDYIWFEKVLGKWYRESCYEEAKKYKSRGAFLKNCVGAYQVSLKTDGLMITHGFLLHHLLKSGIAKLVIMKPINTNQEKSFR